LIRFCAPLYRPGVGELASDKALHPWLVRLQVSGNGRARLCDATDAARFRQTELAWKGGHQAIIDNQHYLAFNPTRELSAVDHGVDVTARPLANLVLL
jgi:hypothetical protein